MANPKADWLGWIVQFVFGFVPGVFVGFMVIHKGRCGGYWIDDALVPYFIGGAGLLGGSLASHYGDRLWMEVRERVVVKPEDYPPGKQLIIGWLGDLQHGVAKWQFGLHDDGRYGAMVWVPVPGMKWRHSRPKVVEKRLTSERATTLIESAVTLPNRFPLECLVHAQVCVDHSGHDGGVHRLRETDTLCYGVTIIERNQVIGSYFLAEDSRAWLTWELKAIIEELIAPAIAAGRHTPGKQGVLP
jgi:hypothetical protein